MYRSLLLIAAMALSVYGHGRMWDPIGRATAWRKGWNTPVDYNDNQLFCGGFHIQMEAGYKCGVCGDPWDEKKYGVRQNEAGGIFATGTIVKHYRQGQDIDVHVSITANHGGWISFKLCPVKDKNEKATQECLDKYPVPFVGGGYTYPVDYSKGKMEIKTKLTLPPNLVCDQCVMQWRYHTGNSWGCDLNNPKDCGMGKGYQEEFYGCSDVKISKTGGLQPKPFAQATTTASSSSGTQSGCFGTGSFTGSATMDGWCQSNCPSNCPSDLCKCS